VARSVIGLDIGTNAATLAEVRLADDPVLESFGQVALAPGAMRDGEVEDDAAVSDAVARLRAEMGLRKAPVRLGFASPRVIVRHVDMPLMSDGDLRSALELQVQDLVPIPIEEAVLDYVVVDRVEDGEGDGEAHARVLLAAAHHSAVARLVSAVEAGGLAVESVDLVPLALIRSLGRRGYGAEAIVSFGSGVTTVAVHDEGVPEFVRTLGTGGNDLTAAIAADLDVAPETAEHLKRQLMCGTPDFTTSRRDHESIERARRAIERPLGILLDEVRSSIDYYRNQGGAAHLNRVVVTGGGSQLPDVTGRLCMLLGLGVDLARPRDELTIGDVGFDEADLPRLDPYLPAAVGLAFDGAYGGVGVDLLTRHSGRRVGGRNPALAGGALAAAALAGLLALPTMAVSHDIKNEKKAEAAATARNSDLQRRIGSLSEAAVKQQQLVSAKAEIAKLLDRDVSWSRMLQELARTIPTDVWLTGFDTSVSDATAAAAAAAAATDTGAPVNAFGGTAHFTATGLDYPSVAKWIDRLSQIPSLTNIWVTSAKKGTYAERDTVDFDSTVELTGKARSNRLQTIVGESK
jgi:type IV pilus assembly protein PilM